MLKSFDVPLPEHEIAPQHGKNSPVEQPRMDAAAVEVQAKKLRKRADSGEGPATSPGESTRPFERPKTAEAIELDGSNKRIEFPTPESVSTVERPEVIEAFQQGQTVELFESGEKKVAWKVDLVSEQGTVHLTDAETGRRRMMRASELAVDLKAQEHLPDLQQLWAISLREITRKQKDQFKGLGKKEFVLRVMEEHQDEIIELAGRIAVNAGSERATLHDALRSAMEQTMSRASNEEAAAARLHKSLELANEHGEKYGRQFRLDKLNNKRLGEIITLETALTDARVEDNDQDRGDTNEDERPIKGIPINELWLSEVRNDLEAALIAVPGQEKWAIEGEIHEPLPFETLGTKKLQEAMKVARGRISELFTKLENPLIASETEGIIHELDALNKESLRLKDAMERANAYLAEITQKAGELRRQATIQEQTNGKGAAWQKADADAWRLEKQMYQAMGLQDELGVESSPLYRDIKARLDLGRGSEENALKFIETLLGDSQTSAKDREGLALLANEIIDRQVEAIDARHIANIEEVVPQAYQESEEPIPALEQPIAEAAPKRRRTRKQVSEQLAPAEALAPEAFFVPLDNDKRSHLPDHEPIPEKETTDVATQIARIDHDLEVIKNEISHVSGKAQRALSLERDRLLTEKARLEGQHVEPFEMPSHKDSVVRVERTPISGAALEQLQKDAAEELKYVDDVKEKRRKRVKMEYSAPQTNVLHPGYMKEEKPMVVAEEPKKKEYSWDDVQPTVPDTAPKAVEQKPMTTKEFEAFRQENQALVAKREAKAREGAERQRVKKEREEKDMKQYHGWFKEETPDVYRNRTEQSRRNILETPSPAFLSIAESFTNDHEGFIDEFEQMQEAGLLKDASGNDITLEQLQNALPQRPFDFVFRRNKNTEGYYIRMIGKAREKWAKMQKAA